MALILTDIKAIALLYEYYKNGYKKEEKLDMVRQVMEKLLSRTLKPEGEIPRYNGIVNVINFYANTK